MPTPTGLPKVGEVWERTTRIYSSKPTRTRIQKIRFVVMERGRGDYWSMRVAIRKGDHYKISLWVDPAYAMQQRQLTYIGPAGPKTKKALGLG